MRHFTEAPSAATWCTHVAQVTIIRRLKTVLKLPVLQIAKAVGRDKTTVYKALNKGWSLAKRGRPEALTKGDVSHLVRTLKVLQEKAAAREEITLAMLKKKAKCKACSKAIRKALNTKGIRFRRMRSKPILTKADKNDRLEFAEKFRSKERNCRYI